MLARLVVALVLGALVGLAAPALATEGDGAAQVRMGTTEIAVMPAPAPAAASALPGDVPVAGAHGLRMPPVPPAYNTHDGGWIRFAYPPASRQPIQALIASADGVRAELSGIFRHPVLGHVEVRVARTQAEMATLAPEGTTLPTYAAGVAFPALGLVLLTLEPTFPNQRHDLGEIFRHELAHVALHDATGGGHVPRWFNEGFAVHASGEASLVRLQTLWTATLAQRLLPLAALDSTFPAAPTVTDVAYAEAADVVRFLLRQRDQSRFVSLFERMRDGQTFEVALADAYSVDRDQLEADWREDVSRRYTFWPIFLSSGVVWLVALVLLAWAWRRRKSRDRATLARWAREEAAEEARREAELVAVEAPPPRLHVVLAEPPRRGAEAARRVLPGVPKVEHDGRWHTLH